jgi:hypothetical protein
MDAAARRKETQAMRALIDGGSELAALEMPLHPRELASHYDLTLTSPRDSDEGAAAFEGWLAVAADSYGLSCARIAPSLASAAAERLAAGVLDIGLHIACDTDWQRDDICARLAFAVQDAGGHPVNPPARARAFTDRAALHHELVRRGLGVPPTVLVRPWTSERQLGDHLRWHLRLDEPGARVEIVPAGRGEVIRRHPRGESIQNALDEVRRHDPDGTYLLRPEIRPPWLVCSDGECRPAHWRVLSCLGEVTAFWWQPACSLRKGQRSYREVTRAEVQSHALAPLFQYVQALADLSGLEWFSTELMLCPCSRPGTYTIPDVAGLDLPLFAYHLDDQCELGVQSHSAAAPPDEYVRRLAWRFAELAWRVRRQTMPADGVIRLRAG